MRTQKFARDGQRACLRGRRGVAALEFAIVAPVMLSLVIFGVDCARAFLIWREIHNAALAIAENAEKLSFSVDPATGANTSMLTYTQMQLAMSSIYPEIPALNLGQGGSLFAGNFSVTLSSVVFSPLCPTATLTGACTAQQPYVLWSAYLEPLGNPPQPYLVNGTLRACGQLISVANFPDDSSQYTKMVNPTMAPGAVTQLTTPPQIVADVQYTFVPYWTFILKKTTFYATATVPAPIGGLDQTTTYYAPANTTAPATGSLTTCTLP